MWGIPMNGITTKFIAALAVFVMAFAGFGVMAVTEVNDAGDTNAETTSYTAGKKLTLVFEGAYIDDANGVLTFIESGNGVIYYVATLDDDFEEKITILNKGYYDILKNNKLIKGMTVTVPLVATDQEKKISIENEDILEGLKIFCSVEISKTGEIKSGLSTEIIWTDMIPADGAAKLTKDITYDVVFEEDAEAAVAAAVAIVEAFYADYSSPEEVAEAIDDAVAKYKDYISPEMVEKAKQAAVEEYIINHPAVEKENKTFFYAFIVVLAVLIAVSGVFAYKGYIKPKMDAKKAAVEAVEPPKQ